MTSGLTFLCILLLGEQKLHLYAKKQTWGISLSIESDKCLTSAFMLPGGIFHGGDFEMVSRVWAPTELCPSKAHGHVN